MLYRTITGLREVAELGNVKAWLLDQFGVLHDGREAYPGAVETLKLLASNGEKLVLLSNSSRRSEVTKNKLFQLGFDPQLFSGIITSGELTYRHLQLRQDPWFASLGRRCVHITWSSRGAISLEGLNLEVVEDPAAADFLLVHGTEAFGSASGDVMLTSVEKIHSVMEAAVRKSLPMIVANPDIVTVEARELRAMPGMLGRKYEEMGGQVRWMGKPDPVIYRAAEEIAGVGAEACVAVGDSLDHDIRGAQLAGLRSIFVAGGIHAAELGVNGSPQQLPQDSSLQSLFQANGGLSPTFVIPMFRW